MTTLCDCPQNGIGTWSFRLLGTPVRVKFWFWIALLILGPESDPAAVFTWLAVCLVSILLHEMGHVMAFRCFRRDAEVVLYGFGGLAIPGRDVEGTFAKVAVSAAGPVAGFCLAALAVAAVVLTGGRIVVGHILYLPHLGVMLNIDWLAAGHSIRLYTNATLLANDLLFANFYWGLVNLLPVWPLDGGHIARALLEQWDGCDGRRKSLIASAVVAAAVALAGGANGYMLLAILFGIFAVSSLQLLESATRRPIPTYRR